MPTLRAMFSLTALTWVVIGAGAGVARADDCSFEGVYGSVRSPVIASGGSGVMLTNVFSDEDADGLGTPDDLIGKRYVLSSRGRVTQTLFSHPLSASLVNGGAQTIMWRADRGIVAGDRVLVAQLPFPGYLGVAGAEAPDGTITLLYASGGTAILQRFAPDGTAGPAIAVAPAPPPVDADDPYTFAPLLTVDAAGTAFGAVAGEQGGVAIRWPAGGEPQRFDAPALVRASAPAIAADQHGGAWIRLDAAGRLSLLHVTTGGAAAVALGAVESVTNLAVDPAGDAVLAYTARRRAHVRRVTLAGVATSPTSLPAGTVEAIAWSRGNPWVLSARADALYLDGPRDQLLIREHRGYTASGASLTIAGGRAWTVWDEASDRLDQECHEFPAVQHVLWSSFALNARSMVARVLPDAAPLT